MVREKNAFIGEVCLPSPPLCILSSPQLNSLDPPGRDRGIPHLFSNNLIQSIEWFFFVIVDFITTIFWIVILLFFSCFYFSINFIIGAKTTQNVVL